MIGRVSFGDGAMHLMERLLKHAGIDEIELDTVLVQPEADEAVLRLLSEAAEGRWRVRVASRHHNLCADIRLSGVDRDGVAGHLLDDDPIFPSEAVSYAWSQLWQVHIY